MCACVRDHLVEPNDDSGDGGSESTRPAIATLQTHDKKVTILGGIKDGGLTVMVKNLDGTIVADGITVDELSRTDPILGALITNAVA